MGSVDAIAEIAGLDELRGLAPNQSCAQEALHITRVIPILGSNRSSHTIAPPSKALALAKLEHKETLGAWILPCSIGLPRSAAGWVAAFCRCRPDGRP
jgi:hypothetical protein